jgi:two-component system cell cycle sensor histidine kinase/response regulator CckA
MMNRAIRILHLEDDVLDAELIARRLEEDGMNCRIERVDSEAGFLTALQHGGVDLVLADFSLPGCDGLEALQLAKQVAPDIPFLIVSGLIGEEAAVDSLRNGATDYILKDRLSRLAPAVRRALDDAGLRRHTKSLGDQLTRAQKLEIFGELAGGVAHDYNNILTIIMANSGLLMAGLGEDTRLHKHASQIEYACAQAATLTRQLLIFSRDRGRDAAVLDLNGVVKNAESMLVRLLPENVELAVTLSTGFLRVIADRGDIEQVLINLVLNARDAIRSHGTIRVETGSVKKAGKNFVFFNVEDNGAGMTQKVKARLFEPFFTTKPEGSGTGLGLATCRRLIQSMHGRITVESNTRSGTRFRIFLPMAEGVEVSQDHAPASTEMLRGSEKILIAEDNHMLRDMMATQLEELGYEVLQASNGMEGLEIFAKHKSNPPVLVIADVALPLLGGREMTRMLMKSSPDLRVLHTSGHTEQTIASLGFPLPQGDVLRKPFTLPELTHRIREILPAAK